MLASGDNVEIFTSKVETAGPSQDWLSFVVSPRARNKIRQWFSRERRVDMVEAGRDDLTAELRRERLPVQQVWKSSELDDGRRRARATSTSTRCSRRSASTTCPPSRWRSASPVRSTATPSEQLPATVATPRRERRDGEETPVGVHVEGLDDVLVRLANCCTPVPGDSIIGFVTRGRGVSVHRSDCANAASLTAEQATRMIEVEWDGDERPGRTFVAGVEVVALDRSRLLRDVTNALADHHVNILSCQTVTGTDRVAKMRFEFEFANPGYLDAVIRTIKGVDSVYDAYRLIPGTVA